MAAVSKPARARAAVLAFPRTPSVVQIGLGRLVPSGRALVVAFGLLVCGALAYVAARETSIFALRSIEVTGAPPRVNAHVRAALRPLDGRNLMTIDASDITTRLDRLPDVARVTFNRDFPHTLRLVVAPAHSVAVVRRGPSAWIVSSDGRIVREIGPRAAPRLPRIWVVRTTDVEVGSTVEDADAARAIAAVVAARASGFATRIRAVRSNDRELTFVLASGFDVRFGDASSMRTKFAVARRIIPLVGASGYLDVSVPERPVSATNSQVGG
jgi:cell division protein FtsQ